MQRTLWIVLSVVFVLVLVSFTVTYQVRFTEKAVLTTFGKADPDSSKGGAGLHFKLPYPIQSVTTYDTRLRFTPAKGQSVSTKDSRLIIVEAYCTWRVSDPLKFYERFSNAGASSDEHFRKASEVISSALSGSMTEIGSFNMDELFARDQGASKLPQLEGRMMQAMVGGSSGVSLSEYGIEARDVGINKIILPEATSKAVNERMAANRDRVAQAIQSQAEAEEVGIKGKADSMSKTILAFAERRAQEIRNKGDLEAAQFIRQMNVNPELAVFLKNIDLLRDSLAKKATLVIPFSAPGMGVFSPNAMDNVRPGQIPGSNMEGVTGKPRSDAGSGTPVASGSAVGEGR